MATSSFSNFLSFFLPTQTKKPPPQQTHLPISPLPSSSSSPSSDSLSLPTHSSISVTPSSSSSIQTHHRKLRHGFDPIIQNDFSSSPKKDLLSVVCPSLAYSNTLFFKTAYNVQIVVAEDESEDALIGRFRREVYRAGVINECKRRRRFENKQEERKRRIRDAAKKNRRRRTPFRSEQMEREEAASKEKEEKEKLSKNDEEDNWDLPEGDIPY